MGLQLLDFVQLPLLNLSITAQTQKSPLQQEEVLLDSTGSIIDESGKNQRGSLARTFLLGGSSALVASPCATPVLTSILAFVANSNDPALGALLLFGYTLGYSTPLLLVAATGGQVLAKLRGDGSSIYSKFGPWVTPITGGILLWYGTNGLLTAVFGDPSLAGLGPIIE
jgi:cytochrome c biogenesis protein CcdA